MYDFGSFIIHINSHLLFYINQCRVISGSMWCGEDDPAMWLNSQAAGNNLTEHLNHETISTSWWVQMPAMGDGDILVLW